MVRETGDFDDFPADTEPASLQDLADRFFTGDDGPAPEPPAAPDRKPVNRFIGVGVGLAVLVAVPVVVTQEPAVSSQPAATRSIQLALDPPDDQGNGAELSWRGPPGLHYAVVVAATAQPAEVIFVGDHQTDLYVPLDAALRYCFQLQATDGTEVYQTPPRAIRDAVCRA